MSRASEMVGAGFVHLHVRSAYSLLEGAMEVGKIADLARGGRHGRPSPSPTPATCSGRWSSPRSLPAPASSRSSGVALAVDFALTREEGRTAVSASAPPAAPDPAGPERGRLCQSDGAFLHGFLQARPAPRPGRTSPPPCWPSGPRGDCLLTGAPARPSSSPSATASRHLAAERAALLAQAFADRLYVEIQRHGTGRSGASSRSCSTSPMPGPALVATNERAISPRALRPQIARCAARHRRGPHPRRDRAAAPDAPALFQEPGEDALALRRSAGGRRRHGGDRQAVRLPGSAPASRSCRAFPSVPAPSRWPRPGELRR